ncbi:MAG: hypothetical protein RR497_02140 [Oscillospiraceae bacterium]
MAFIEDELEILVHGENGEYGLLRKLDNGKYISNILILDIDEYKKGSDIFKSHLGEFCSALKDVLQQNREKILKFPYLSKQSDVSFILWCLISSKVWELDAEVRKALKQTTFQNITEPNRQYTSIGLATKYGEELNIGFYGCDGIKSAIGANDICGYSSVFLSNIYGAKVERHFSCGHNISTDELILMTIHSIKGIDINNLSVNEKEVAAKAIECGYLRKDENILTPKIIVIPKNKQEEFYSLLNEFSPKIKKIAYSIAKEISPLVKKTVPKHLINEYSMYCMASSIGLLYDVIEYCITESILTTPTLKLSAEGVMMIVEK